MTKYSLIVLLIFINAGLLIEACRIVGANLAAAHQAARDKEIDNQFATGRSG